MATKGKEGVEGVVSKEREKKGNSSSNPPPTKISKPSTKASTSQQSSSSSNKPIPNYLRPTISSNTDPSSSRITRRPTTLTSSASTPSKSASITRRLSLEKPTRAPSNTTTNTRAVKTATRATPTSTLPKTTLSPVKPGPQRSYSSMSSRSTKAAAAAASSGAPPIRRSLSTRAPSTSNSNSSSLFHRKALKKTAPKSVASDSSTEVEAHDKDILDHIVNDDEGGMMDDHEVESLPEISEMPGQEEQLGDPVMTPEEALNAEMEEQDQQKAADELLIEDALEEKGALDGVTEVEEKHVVVVLQGSLGDETETETEAETEQVGVPESPATQAGNKKESQAYNDVIEETANKLMENRKNKVRALAGAFETVISLDSK